MSRDRSDLSERMARAARALQQQADPQETMDTAVQLALANVDGAGAAGLSIVRRRRDIDSPAHTHDFVGRCDQLQDELREGPCFDAIFDDEVVHSPDLLSEHRWSRWAPTVADELGIRSMLCFRLFTNDDNVGALNLYSTEPGAFAPSDRDDGLAIAAHIAVSVAAAQEIDQLELGMRRRTVIGEALGIMMERFDLQHDAAFSVLARISSQANRKLFDIAVEIVETRQVPHTRGEAVRQR